MSDHPRTDAVFDKNKKNPHIVCLADLEVCSRELETDLAKVEKERDELHDALKIAVEYITESLTDYDFRYGGHPAVEDNRMEMQADLEKLQSILEKLKSKGGNDE